MWAISESLHRYCFFRLTAIHFHRCRLHSARNRLFLRRTLLLRECLEIGDLRLAGKIGAQIFQQTDGLGELSFADELPHSIKLSREECSSGIFRFTRGGQRKQLARLGCRALIRIQTFE